MHRRAKIGLVLLPLALLAACGTSMTKVMDKAKAAKNRAQLEDALGKPLKSESATINGKTVEMLTFKADDGEVTYSLEDDKIINVGPVEKKKPAEGEQNQK